MSVEFSEENAARVCSLAAEGKTLNLIAKEIGTSRTTIWRWRSSNPLFERGLQRALEEGAHAMIDETVDIADTELDAQIARNRIAARQWSVERRYRRMYGASIDMTLTQQVDVGGTLIEARKRVVLPGCDLTQIPVAQYVEYAMIEQPRTTDTQSVTPRPDPFVDPFE